MARARFVKPALRTSRVVAAWPIPARYAWVLLWGYLDDKGRGIDDVRLIVADLFPLDRDVTEKKMETWLRLYTTPLNPEREAPLCRYTVAGDSYLHATNWSEHQHPNRPTPSVIPPCPTHERLTESLTEPSPTDSHPRVERLKGREVEGVSAPRSLTEPPSPNTAPSPTCERHPHGTDEPCGPCAIARRAATTWQKPTPTPPSVAELRASGVIR